MRIELTLLLLTGTFLWTAAPSHAQPGDRLQRKLEQHRLASWPPERNYSRISLGYALQNTFERHVDYCGFKVDKNKRDYVPADIQKFLGRRDLRTKVETADIRGGGLMNYIFTEEDIRLPFDNVRYSPTRVFKLNSVDHQFVVNPDDNFDSFILTKNCSGFLKAALDAGIEPPYVAFKTALDTDSRRESTVMGISGSFVSPLKFIFDANNHLTTEAMMQLWKFYEEHPEFIGNAWYLREFEGVMIRHISTAEENYRIESEVGINLNGPLSTRLKSSFGIGFTSGNKFAGTDWQTIIFADFAGNYTKERLFSPLPSPAQIREYFHSVKPAFQKANDFPLMTEGVEHRHYLIVEGIPENMAANFWEIENVRPGVYEETPQLSTDYLSDSGSGVFGCRFTIAGRPLIDNFQGPFSDRPSRLNVAYTLRSRSPVGGQYLRLYVQEELQTSSHPIATVSRGEFDLKKKEDRRFALQWKFAIEIEDAENPVDFNEIPYIDNLLARRSDGNLPIKLAGVDRDAHRRIFYITLETVETYPLDKIDDLNMITYNLSLDVHLRSVRSAVRSVRPVKSVLMFPTIRKDPPPEAAPADHQPPSSGQGMEPQSPLPAPAQPLPAALPERKDN
jgi:hypothetical protein